MSILSVPILSRCERLTQLPYAMCSCKLAAGVLSPSVIGTTGLAEREPSAPQRHRTRCILRNGDPDRVEKGPPSA